MSIKMGLEKQIKNLNKIDKNLPEEFQYIIENKDEYIKNISWFLRTGKSMHNFKFDSEDIHNYQEMFIKSNDNWLFKDNNAVDIRLPFQHTIFWCGDKSTQTKLGMICKELNDDEFQVWYLLKSLNCPFWAMMPIISQIKLDGDLAHTIINIHYSVNSKKVYDDLVTNGYINKIYLPSLNVILLVLGCKNITFEKEANYSPKKKKKKPTESFYTLKINPNLTRTKYVNSEPTGIKKRFHICRGHFKTYTKEKPLFGKIHGRFWIPSHTRGEIEEGLIEKDYELNSKKEIKNEEI